MPIKPLFLLADSQLLFLRGRAGIADRIRAELPATDPKAVYIGASNEDNREFYDLFVAAMEMIAVRNCRMASSRFREEERAFFLEADLVLLAGGDVERGWRTFEQNGLRDLISQKRYEGATLVGVSAGAVQLGLGTLTHAAQPKKLSLFQFAPFYVSAHAEQDDWFDLRAIVTLSQAGIRGLGIPAGGGAIYSPDGGLEPVRKPLLELVKTGGVSESLLLPAPGGS